ncbi:protein ALTERED PHOSPHATE STARVATION RESPONSE 1-like [Triticum dicoccoides]|uniref:protein ALTERED PHOSPHATE STARVATION RESPONSE 1-like n=1 Tax=Triticum dicoccoides TaxID=85692 RepID=UPI00188E4F4C|nr:protein ALTERED PHOSPHATE STARVATION RESPONSE 1-like [Triticum dicoccoides]
MGCRSSRLDAADVSPVAALCRERRDLMLAAGDRRAVLAAAHAAYFRALPRVADALARFAHEHHAASPPGSPVLTLPPSDHDEPKKPSASSSTPHTDSGHSHIHFHSDASDSDPDSADDCACDAPGHGHGARGGVSGRGEIPPPAGVPQQRHIPEPAAVSPAMPWQGRPAMPWGGMPQMPWDGRPEMPWAQASYDAYPSSFPIPDVAIPNAYYMKASSATANTVYQEPYGYSNFATNVPSSYMGYEYGYNNPMYGVPEGGQPAEHRGREAAAPAPAPPPPMPMPEASPWDFFNPFDSYNQDLPHYNQKGFAPDGSFSSSPNSSEVREREGIPELEEETEHESSMRESLKARKAVESTASNRIDNVDVSAKVKVSMEHTECEIDSVVSASVLDSGEGSVCSCDCDNANAGGGGAAPAGDDPAKVKRVSSEEHSSMVVGENAPLPSFGTRDVAEIVEEIKEQFNSAVACGDDVARILEVGSIRYRPRSTILKLIVSRMMGTFALLFSEPPVKNAEQSTVGSSNRTQNSSKRIDSTSGVEINTLSSIMDRLYVWEKRLHKEIMEEEKLRITYDKEWKRLKELDESGAEPYKIDSTRASIRTLLTRINIAMRSAKVISRRIHILRDDELHPHLVKLIQGHVRMWKFILECHRKQFHSILETKSHILIPKNGPERNSSKVTLELEMELLNWCSCFRNWITSQKAYIETLNGWLLKWLPQEKEETSDGIAPFSPGRLGAPGVFITANDWCQTMKRIPEGAVVDAMEAFAVNVHILWERQDEAHQQKMKTDYLSRDFSKRLKSHQKDQVLPGHPKAGKAVLPDGDNGRAVDSRMVALDALHTRLDEQRARHEETVREIQESSATDLKAGLAPIFEALESFTQETLKGYENVRVPDSGIA